MSLGDWVRLCAGVVCFLLVIFYAKIEQWWCRHYSVFPKIGGEVQCFDCDKRWPSKEAYRSECEKRNR